MDGRALMKVPDMAFFLADDGVTEALKGANESLA